jgi:hypothetical protein
VSNAGDASKGGRWTTTKFFVESVKAFRGQRARGEAPDNNVTAIKQVNGRLEAAGQTQRRDCLEDCAQVPTGLRSFARARVGRGAHHGMDPCNCQGRS